MEHNYSFPTQGELVQFAFNAFGVLPRKGDQGSDFDETDKKRVQKLLNRLSKEEGLLLDNYAIVRSTLIGLLSRYVTQHSHVNLMLVVVQALYDEYNRMILEEGTYETKLNSLSYFLLTKAMPSTVNVGSLAWLFSQHQHRLEQIPPLYVWMLPTIEGENVTKWPLAKTMAWVYEQFGVSQRQFHLGSGSSDSDAFLRERSLETARKWSQGDALPSTPALVQNFIAALDNQPELKNAHLRLVEALPFILMCARLSTFLGQSMSKHYGTDFLGIVTRNSERLVFMFRAEMQEFEKEFCRALGITDLGSVSSDRLHLGLNHHANFMMRKSEEVSRKLDELADADPDNPFNPKDINKLRMQYGDYVVWKEQLLLIHSGLFPPSEAFVKTLGIGHNLLKLYSEKEADIVEYEELVDNSGLSEQLGWMRAWVRASYEYRINGPKAALEHYRQAMEMAKYRAGKTQYLLVNKYLEMCAKTDDKKAFKKGLEWANYLKIKIRWLRNEEQTDEAIELAMGFLKVAKYPGE